MIKVNQRSLWVIPKLKLISNYHYYHKTPSIIESEVTTSCFILFAVIPSLSDLLTGNGIAIQCIDIVRRKKTPIKPTDIS